MNTKTRSIYLSAVGWEFESYKDDLAHALTRREFLVKSREDFPKGAGQLEAIEAYIRQSDAVICLVGEQFGQEPDAEQTAAFADISKGRHSFAQWEYLFGTHVAKSLHVFLPAKNTPPDHRNEDSSLKKLQQTFRQTWLESGTAEPIEFTDHASLCEEALVIPSLNPNAKEPVIARALNLENPYVGLRKFDEQDSTKFFGRKDLADEIISKVGKSPLLTVFGRSGSGKSSVVRAGVIPRFRKEYPAGKVVLMAPGRDPFSSLANAMLNAGLPEDVAIDAQLPSSRKFRDLLANVSETKEPWMIFIDQFEEIFTLPGKHDAPVIFQFVQSLIDLVSESKSQVRIVLALRDDFIGRLGEFRGLAGAVDRNLVRVTQPSWEELCEIVEQPAANHGVRFENNLVARIVSHVEGKPQRLPFLQFAMERLWEVEKADKEQFGKGMVVDEDFEKMGGLHDRRINRSSYRQINGVDGALPAKMESVFADRNPAELRRIRSFLLSFVAITDTDLGPTAVTKSETLENLKKTCGIGSRALIDEMLKERIIVETDASFDSHPVYELAHEALIHAWRHFDNWVGDIRDAAQMKRVLSVDAHKWDSKRSAKAKIAHSDLWGGAKLSRALEFKDNAKGAKQSDFDRVGGLDDLEIDYLEASGDRYIKEIKSNLGESAVDWKKSKSKDLLWSGTRLQSALELNQTEEGADKSEFDRIGGLDKIEQKFLKLSEKNSHPKSIGTRVALVMTTGIALLAIFFALAAPVADVANQSSVTGFDKVKAWVEKFLSEKE